MTLHSASTAAATLTSRRRSSRAASATTATTTSTTTGSAASSWARARRQGRGLVQRAREDVATFTYTPSRVRPSPVLILSNEDCSGAARHAAAPGRSTSTSTVAARRARRGLRRLRRRPAARRRHPRRPEPLLGRRLVHGRRLHHAGADSPGSGISKLAIDIQLRVRDFLNEGGSCSTRARTRGFAQGYAYNPFQGGGGRLLQNEARVHRGAGRLPAVLAGGEHLRRRRGHRRGRSPYPVRGFADPFDGSRPLATSDVGDRDGTIRTPHSASFLVTSSILDPDEYPDLAGSRRLLVFDRPGGRRSSRSPASASPPRTPTTRPTSGSQRSST